MDIKYVTDDDKEFLMSIDKHVNEDGYRNRVYTKSGYVMLEENQYIGIIILKFLFDLCNLKGDKV